MNFLGFLFLHFISSFGDSLLYFALPLGLGIATQDIRSTILMFFVPGVAVRFSVFFAHFIKKRVHNAAFDYALISVVLGIVELLTAYAFSLLDSHFSMIFCAVVFVFFYAFLKEGIPRLLFSVNVYSYFVAPDDYQKAVSYGHLVRVVATFVGGIAAGYVLYRDNWQWALYIDALTFLIYGVGLAFLAKKIKTNNVNSLESNRVQNNKISSKITASERKLLFLILYLVPFVSFVSCLYFPYINLLIEKYKLAKTYQGVYLVSWIGLMVSLANLVISKKSVNEIWTSLLTLAIPLSFFTLSILFCLEPSLILYFLLVIFYQSYQTIFNTLDFSLRIKLPAEEMLKFNSDVLKKFSNAQIFSCVLALGFYSFNFPLSYLILFFLTAAVYYAFLWNKFRKSVTSVRT